MTRSFASLHTTLRAGIAAALGVVLLAAPLRAQTSANSQPRSGGSVRIGFIQPASLNPYFVTDAKVRALADLNLDGLARVSPDGSFVPVLTSEVPTLANGDVSPEGMVVTWKLKHGVIWSDGQAFTSQDVIYTYQMLMDPTNPVAARTDYSIMESVTAPDEHTVVVTYKQLYAPYRLAFPSVFPAHVFNGQTNISQDPFNQAPTIGTGPFMFTSSASGDTLTYNRNPKYREPGKPYLDQVIIKFMATRDGEVQALAAGDLDVAYNLDQSSLPQLATLSDVHVDPAPNGVEQLYVNTSCSSGPQQGDPACPNAVLGDVRVRQAIELAIDKQGLVHNLMADLVKPAVSVLPSMGAYAVDLQPSEFNPDKSRQLLDQAGWVVGADGIRGKGGERGHLSLFVSPTNTLSVQTAQVIAGELQDVGLEAEIRESPALANGFVGHSPLNLGNFDLAVFGGGIPTDPQGTLYNRYASDQVPNPQLQTGSNFDRIQDPKLDQALTAAGSTLDDAARRAAYTSFSEELHGDEGVIPLYPTLQLDARNAHVEGWGPTNVNDFLTWNIQDWWFNQ
jgi:peptide/nickel transport system substrate-binding protein